MTHYTSSDDAMPPDLEHAWRSLPVPVGQRLEAQRLADWSGGPVLAAIDAAGMRHLLVGLPEAMSVRPIRPSRGLRMVVRRLRIGPADEHTWMDISCPEPTLHRLFSSLTGEILQTLSGAVSQDASTVTAVIERWRRFWSVPMDGLSREGQLGLLGELWLLTRWLPVLTAEAVRAWAGPLGGRHDFACSNLSVEVKSSGAATGPTLHRIQSLDQLAEPVTGGLYLLSLRFAADSLGQISLDNLIEEARAFAATNDVLADELDQRLAATGWTPADRGRYDTTWRIARQALYEVGAGFPRLTTASFPEGLPPGVTDVGYTLDVSVCDPWLVEAQPSTDSCIVVLAGDG